MYPSTESHKLKTATRDKQVQMVGIAEAKISSCDEQVLCAPNLGSCLGLAVYDPKTNLGGVLHCLLPMSSKDPAKAKNKPYMYVDTGLPLFLTQFLERGSKKTDLIIVAAGCAAINDKNGYFNIGKKNHTVFRKLTWKNNLLVKSEHVGGENSRTLKLFISTGEIWLSTEGKHTQLA